MQKENTKFVSSTIFEGMTSIRSVIKAIDNGTSDRKIQKILFDGEKLHKIKKEVGYFKAVSDKYGFILEKTNSDELDKITLGSSHGGIVAICSDRTIPCLDTTKIKPNGFYAMIQGIEDPYNFGYSLRSLYACGCDGIILPQRNWMSAAGVVARSSAGASELLDIFTSDDIDAVNIFKSLGYSTVCAEETYI